MTPLICTLEASAPYWETPAVPSLPLSVGWTGRPLGAAVTRAALSSRCSVRASSEPHQPAWLLPAAPHPPGGVESHVCFLVAGPFRVLITGLCKEVLPGFRRSKVVSLLLCRIFIGNFTSRFAAEGDGPDGWGLCWLLSVFVLRVCCLVAFFFPEVLCPMVSQKQWTEGTVT